MGEKRNVYRLLVGKPVGKRPLGRPTCRWIDDRYRWRDLVNAVMNLWVP
jgi:hypothetical protein